MSTPPPADPTPTTPGVPAGWYPDPGSGQPRWWDGTKWTTTFVVDGIAQTVGPTPTFVVAPTAGQPTATNGWAIVSIICGIVALVLSFLAPFLFGVSFVLALIALLAGLDGLRKAKLTNSGGRGLAIAGVVLGGLPLAVIAIGALAYFNT